MNVENKLIPMFAYVSHMNRSFGNKKGNPLQVDMARLAKQLSNIPDEIEEISNAFDEWNAADELCYKLYAEVGPVEDPEKIKALDDALAQRGKAFDKIRDGICDVMVFALGGYHFMGADPEVDMNSVLDGVMTRFIKDEADKLATIAKHAAKGVTDVYFEGEYPTMIMKSGSDQPDAPKGKFLKSASYTEPVFVPMKEFVEHPFARRNFLRKK